jgi:hypothetical protein
LPPEAALWRSRLFRQIGGMWDLEARLEEALQAFDQAEASLGQAPEGEDSEWWLEWVEIQMERISVLYWKQELAEVTRLIEKSQPIVEKHASREARILFSNRLLKVALMRDRFVPSDQTLAQVQAARQWAARPEADLNEIASCEFMLGWCRLWRGEGDEAERHLQASLALDERTGDVLHRSMSLSYLAVLARKRGQVDVVRESIQPCLDAAAAAQRMVYTGMARANQAWLAAREGDWEETQVHGCAALELWELFAGDSMPFRWLALRPLLGAALAHDQVAEAIDHARALLAPKQQRLPEALTAALEAAIQCWEAGQSEAARVHLDQAMPQALVLGYA